MKSHQVHSAVVYVELCSCIIRLLYESTKMIKKTLYISDDCRYGVFKQFMEGELECHCPERCWYDTVLLTRQQPPRPRPRQTLLNTRSQNHKSAYVHIRS